MEKELLIEALRNCSDGVCSLCPYDDHELSTKGCEAKLMRDAAAALEAADKRIARLEEDLKTREAEREVMQDSIKICEEAADRYKAQLPKEGEWIDIDGTMFAKCSVCGKRHYGCTTPYCDMCGARMRKGEQE